MSILRRSCLGILVVAALGCADLAAMMELQQGLATRFKEPGISLNVNNREDLSVVFVNSKIAALPDSERAAVAREVAQFVRDHYRGYASLTTIAVGFRQAKQVGVVTYSTTDTPYTFSTSELGAQQDTLQTQLKQ